MRKFILIVCGGLMMACISINAEECFLRNDERWLLIGDSITDNGIYCRMVYKTFKHFHPEAEIKVTGNGIGGVPSDHKFSLKEKNPTLVTIMLGMNDVIHYGYKQREVKKILDSYRKNITDKVKQFKALGADVVLMTPTLTDEGFRRYFWELRGTKDILKKFGGIIKEIAEREKVFYLPIQEEFEAYHETRLIEQPLRQDGVHPTTPGQYQIARSFWEHFNFPGRLLKKTEQRKLSNSFHRVPVKVVSNNMFMSKNARDVQLSLSADKSLQVKLRWSIGESSGYEELTINKTGVSCSIKLREKDLAMLPGESRQLIFDMTSSNKRSLYILDFHNKPVLHFKENKIFGKFHGNKKRGDSTLIGTWEVEKKDEHLLIAGEVYDEDIQSHNPWPWGRDSVSVWLDLRKGGRFGDIGVDEDVYMSIISAHNEPKFGCHLIPWCGRGMTQAANCGGSKTEKGWKWHLFIKHAFVEMFPFKLSEYDFIGFNLIVCDENRRSNGTYFSTYHTLHKTDFPMDKYPSGMMLIDLNNKIKEREITQLHLWGQ